MKKRKVIIDCDPGIDDSLAIMLALKSDVYKRQSLSNAMEEIQKDFNETYPDVEILYNADSSGTLQTQIEEGARCDIFFSAADKQMDALVDEDLVKKDTVEDILENKVVLIKPKAVSYTHLDVYKRQYNNRCMDKSQ